MATVLVQYVSPLQVWKVLGFLVNRIPNVRIACEKIVWWIKNRGLGLLWHTTSVALELVILWWFEKRCFFPWQAISPQTVLHHLDFLFESLFHFFYPISKQSCAICRFQFLDNFRCMWFAQIVGKCIWNSVAHNAEFLASLQVEVSSLYIIWEIWISLQEKAYSFSEDAERNIQAYIYTERHTNIEIYFFKKKKNRTVPWNFMLILNY